MLEAPALTRLPALLLLWLGGLAAGTPVVFLLLVVIQFVLIFVQAIIERRFCLIFDFIWIEVGDNRWLWRRGLAERFKIIHRARFDVWHLVAVHFGGTLHQEINIGKVCQRRDDRARRLRLLLRRFAGFRFRCCLWLRLDAKALIINVFHLGAIGRSGGKIALALGDIDPELRVVMWPVQFLGGIFPAHRHLIPRDCLLA